MVRSDLRGGAFWSEKSCAFLQKPHLQVRVMSWASSAKYRSVLCSCSPKTTRPSGCCGSASLQDSGKLICMLYAYVFIYTYYLLFNHVFLIAVYMQLIFFKSKIPTAPRHLRDSQESPLLPCFDVK